MNAKTITNKLIFNNVDATHTDEELLKLEKTILKGTTMNDRQSGCGVAVGGVIFRFGPSLLNIDEGIRAIPVVQVDKRDKIIRVN